MNSLNYIYTKYNLNLDLPSPIYIDETRNSLCAVFKELNFKEGAEIGVDRGIYAKLLCEANPSVKLYCVDSWKVYKDEPHYSVQKNLNIAHRNTIRRLAPYNCEIINKSSASAVKGFQDNSLDFVYIDANHNFKYALEDITKWSRKVRPGGIVSGHDYIWNSSGVIKYDVKEALEKHIKENNISPIFIYTHLSSSTWFYVK